MVTKERLITAEEFLLMEFEDGKRYELVHGILEEMPVSGEEASAIGLWFGSLIVQFVQKNKLGHVTGADGGYMLDNNPDLVRYPDVGFVSFTKLPKRIPGFVPFAPELAVEVISPSDRPTKVHNKAKEYLHYGSKMVWILDPEDKTIEIYTPVDAENVNIRTLNINGTLDGGDVLPGFKVAVKDIFEW